MVVLVVMALNIEGRGLMMVVDTYRWGGCGGFGRDDSESRVVMGESLDLVNKQLWLSKDPN